MVGIPPGLRSTLLPSVGGDRGGSAFREGIENIPLATRPPGDKPAEDSALSTFSNSVPLLKTEIGLASDGGVAPGPVYTVARLPGCLSERLSPTLSVVPPRVLSCLEFWEQGHAPSPS